MWVPLAMPTIPGVHESTEESFFMQLSASIFKAYDIRGVVPSTLTPEVAEALGRAFGSAARAAGELSLIHI